MASRYAPKLVANGEREECDQEQNEKKSLSAPWELSCMRGPDVVNGTSLDAEFPANPATKRNLVIAVQVMEGIAENQT